MLKVFSQGKHVKIIFLALFLHLLFFEYSENTNTKQNKLKNEAD